MKLYSEDLSNVYVTKKPITNRLWMSNVLIERKNHVFRHSMTKRGGGRNLERRNVERPVFRNFELRILKWRKIGYSHILFSNFLNFFLETIWTSEIFNNFWYCKILIFQMVKLKKFLHIRNFLIWKIRQFFKLNSYSNFGKLGNFKKLEIFGILGII